MLPGETVLSGCKLATTDDFQVMRSAAGWYVGTTDRSGFPCTRETGYFASQEECKEALDLFTVSGHLRKRRT
jgi:hypothetical protein